VSARRKLVALLAALAAALVLAGCHAPGFAVQHPADKQGEQAARLWSGTQLVALAVGLIVWGLIVFVVVRYRRRTPDGAAPSQRAENFPLEVLYTVTPLVIVATLFAFTTAAQRKMNAVSTHPDLTVGATAFQWGWRFAYENGASTSSDGGIPAELELPVGQTTEIDLTATDVVHAFYVPAFLFQRAAVPGAPTRFDITPTKTGVFAAKCSTFCGIGHAKMLFTVRVVSSAQFRQWLTSQAPPKVASP
jgi:cytochrome c oxidase subunit 2